MPASNRTRAGQRVDSYMEPKFWLYGLVGNCLAGPMPPEATRGQYLMIVSSMIVSARNLIVVRCDFDSVGNGEHFDRGRFTRETSGAIGEWSGNRLLVCDLSI